MGLLCVATVTPRKRHDLLVRALASVPSRDWHLTCGGSLDRDPAAVARLEGQLRANGLDDHVSLVGEVDAAVLAEYYHRADLFVLPSDYEGYGMAVAEALARGLPIIATRTGAAPDLVGSQGGTSDAAQFGAAAGILVAPGDREALSAAIEQLLSDPHAMARFAAGARLRRDHLRGWDDAVRQMAEVLPQATGDGRFHG